MKAQGSPSLACCVTMLASPEPIKDWSLTSLKEKLIKIGGTALAVKDLHDSRVHLITPLPSLIHCSHVPRGL